MIRPFRNSLIIFIALLQLVAPLVHAHASNAQAATRGIHLPGLEFINAGKNLPGVRAEASRSDCCGILIGVSCGLQQSKAAAEMPVALDSHPQFTLYRTDFIVAAINFSPQPPHFSSLIFLQPLSPRAPPFFAA